jgi:hypothetical protein
VYQSTGNHSVVVGFHLTDAFDAFDVPESVMNRLLCHALVQHLQDRGLPEAVERLSDMVGFYENPPPPYRVLPQGPPIIATIGQTIVRPVYPVTEEE